MAINQILGLPPAMLKHSFALSAVLALLVACEVQDDQVTGDVDTSAIEVQAEIQERERVESSLRRNMDRMEAYADSIEEALRPVPLLTNSDRNEFRRFRNAQQLQRARQLGISQPVTEAAIEQHLADGTLVQMDDNQYWALRDMDYSRPLATPDLIVLMEELVQRFQERIAEDYDLPPLRLEVTSLLRTAENQRALRQVNPNAAAGTSTHQFGTTIDVTYASFIAPYEPQVELDLEDAPWLEPHLRRVEVLAAETGAARMSRELKAILGHVLIDMQNEGKVMVTLEQRQPVFHFTVAERLAS